MPRLVSFHLAAQTFPEPHLRHHPLRVPAPAVSQSPVLTANLVPQSTFCVVNIREHSKPTLTSPPHSSTQPHHTTTTTTYILTYIPSSHTTRNLRLNHHHGRRQQLRTLVQDDQVGQHPHPVDVQPVLLRRPLVDLRMPVLQDQDVPSLRAQRLRPTPVVVGGKNAGLRRARWHVPGCVFQDTGRTDHEGGGASARREIAEEHSTTRDRHGPASLMNSFSKHLVRQEMRPGDNKCSGSLRPFSLEGDEPSSVGTRSATSRSGYSTDPPSHDVSTCPCFNLPWLASPAKSRMWCSAAALHLFPFSLFSSHSPPTVFLRPCCCRFTGAR